MQKFCKIARLCCLIGLAQLSPLAAQSPVDQQAGESTANIYYLDRRAGVAGVEIHGPINKAVATKAVELITSIRPDVDELTVYLNSPGGDVLTAIELGEEIKKQWTSTAVDDNGQCLGACVLVLAAGVRRTAAPNRVGLQRLSFNQHQFASVSRDRAKPKQIVSAKRVEMYLAHMGMPKKLFQEMMRQPPDKVLLLDARRLKDLGLDGIDRAYEDWLRTKDDQQPSQPD
jgi:hypothetical protein